MRYTHIIEDLEKFKHYIRDTQTGATSPPVGYTQPAVLKLSDGCHIVGVTEYYAGSPDFPNPSAIYKVCELSS